MKKLIIALAVLVVVGEASALAQSRNKNNMGTNSMGSSSSDSSSRPSVQAPVGHRQPRAGDVPDEKDLGGMNDSMSRDDVALDRKIKSICRGC
jgi:hypothetical protein